MGRDTLPATMGIAMVTRLVRVGITAQAKVQLHIRELVLEAELMSVVFLTAVALAHTLVLLPTLCITLSAMDISKTVTSKSPQLQVLTNIALKPHSLQVSLI